MSKLTKPQIKAHEEACELLKKDRLTEDDRWFVLENWQESARHVNSAAGAFFTPPMLARDFAIEVPERGRVVDLCAGIGGLAFQVWLKAQGARAAVDIVCIELNPDYAAVGRKILPEATWIEADVFALPQIGRFETAISNPPFGATKRSGDAPRYRGKNFDLHVIDIASDIADYGVFIIPQGSSPFEYSGRPGYCERRSEAYEAFHSQTGLTLTPNCGIDCDFYRKEWRGVAPAVEIVCCDFVEARAARAATAEPEQIDLFGVAA
jgi:predicted RNA methylase